MIDINNLKIVDVDLPTQSSNRIFGDTPNKINVKVENFTFETLYVPNEKSKKLFVLLSSGGRSVQDTRFDRWSMYGYSDANIICIEDPMYKLYKRLATGWYFGTKEHSIVNELKQIVYKIMFDKQIEVENICIIGSSCGGYAAMYLANLLQGCCCIAMNPQFIVSNWGKSSETLERRIGMSLLNDEDPYKRNDITYISEGKKSKYFIIGNKLVKRDWDNQLSLFFSVMNPSKVDGCNNLFVRDNFVFYVSENKYTRPHYNVIDSFGLILINEILKSSNVDFTALQTLMNTEEKTWELNDRCVNYEYWNDFFKGVFVGCNLSCPSVQKNKVSLQSFDKIISLTAVGKQKFKSLEFSISLKNTELFSKFMAVFDNENQEGFQITNKSVNNNVLKFLVSEDLKDKFQRVISIVDKFFLLEKEFISVNS